MYDLFAWLSRKVRPIQADLPRSCIFDERYGCIISEDIPTQNLGTTFDFQAMALNCGYRGGKDDWWHIHHSGPARDGAFAHHCPHSYRPGRIAEAEPCDCMDEAAEIRLRSIPGGEQRSDG